ncbi:hypothetical protein FQN51_002749 [Onygenales sp. PD_10]|nr:hypothetical protein FQN51_002749 [Onygenales sp. PD_10]
MANTAGHTEPKKATQLIKDPLQEVAEGQITKNHKAKDKSKIKAVQKIEIKGSTDIIKRLEGLVVLIQMIKDVPTGMLFPLNTEDDEETK